MKIDKNKILLRRASLSDIETLIKYRIVFLSETYGTRSYEMEAALEQSLREYFTASLKSDSFVSWIAEYESKPVGFSGLVIREQPGNFEVPCGKTGYILNMFTINEFRKNGICSLLLQKLIEEAKQKGIEKLELHATSEGEPVYTQLGFIEPHDKALEIVIK